MPLQLPPSRTPVWYHSIEQLLHQDDIDIKRLWQYGPPIPDGQQGAPWLGKEIADRLTLPSPAPTTSSSSSSSSSSSRSFNCIPCSGQIPSQWSLTLSGISNNGCGSCSSLNGTWVLDHAPGTPVIGIGSLNDRCRWRAVHDVCGAHDEATAPYLGVLKIYTTSSSPNDGFTLVIGISGNGAFGAGGGVFYLQDGPFVWNCNAANTMVKVITGSACNGWPDELTLTPIP